MTDSAKWYGAHLEDFKKNAYIKSLDEYRRMYRMSIDSPEVFWAEQALEYLAWDKPWRRVLDYDFEQGRIEWFSGGRLNASVNCLDRHLELNRAKTAYFWQGDEPGDQKRISYADLHDLANRIAGILKGRGVKKGDRVIVYLPHIPELPAAMLACARIGAVHSVVFGGFSAKALAKRIRDCRANAVITCDGAFRAGKKIDYKINVDQALARCSTVETVLVFRRTVGPCDYQPPRDVRFDEAVAHGSYPDSVDPEPMDAEDPLFILYTSGATGPPKGIVHTHGGYLLHVAMATKLIFNIGKEDTFWCTADIGWITGHSFGVYGLLLNGFTGVLFEGAFFYPDSDRFWQIIEQYGVNQWYTAPTVLRCIAARESDPGAGHDISSLRLMGCAGDKLDEKTWQWLYHRVGKGRCPIVDTYMQIETGAPLLTPLPGVAPLKPSSCAFPFFGVDPVILDDAGEEVQFPGQEGVLCVKKPWPGMMRTIYGDHERFVEPYLNQIPEFFFTADAAKKDEDDYFEILGRVDDVINVSGYRIGAAEIEAALTVHPSVYEAAVVGYPHPIKGQGIYAFVVLKSGQNSSPVLEQELIASVRSEIGPIAKINIIQWADSLPKTRSGKIIRHILEKIAAGALKELKEGSCLTDAAVIDKLIQGHRQLQ